MERLNESESSVATTTTSCHHFKTKPLKFQALVVEDFPLRKVTRINVLLVDVNIMDGAKLSN